MLIAGDIGGTKTDLAIYDVQSGPRAPVARAVFRSADYPSLQAVVARFVADMDVALDAGVFAVAGPVIGRHVKTTNLPWVVDERALAADLNLRDVHLMNDLEAVARSLPHLQSQDLVTLREGIPDATGSIGVIAPGTGLGEAFLTWHESRYVAHCCEGGHSDFAPRDELQMGLLHYLSRRFDHVSVEAICSGVGLPNIYRYLRDRGGIAERPGTDAIIASARDRTRAIIEAADDPERPSPLCRAAVDVLVATLASEAGNLALKIFATGGIYIAGGIAVRLLARLQERRFIDTFSRKGRLAGVMERVPIHVITSRAALVGAATYGLENLYSMREAHAQE